MPKKFAREQAITNMDFAIMHYPKVVILLLERLEKEQPFIVMNSVILRNSQLANMTFILFANDCNGKLFRVLNVYAKFARKDHL